MREIGLEQGKEGGGEPTVLIPSAESSAPGQRAEARREGLVVALAPGLFEVVTDDDASYLCTLRGRLRKSRPAPRAAANSVNARVPKDSRSATALAAPPNDALPPCASLPATAWRSRRYLAPRASSRRWPRDVRRWRALAPRREPSKFCLPTPMSPRWSSPRASQSHALACWIVTSRSANTPMSRQ